MNRRGAENAEEGKERISLEVGLPIKISAIDH
jgi:hypothetical protein